jgi:glyoxylase-like metal-dependent hydrolase (beta-lactamase superfamily II)
LIETLWDRVELLDGDRELFEGVRTVHTGGHTPGHQMVYLDTPHGRAIITGDAAYVAELNVVGGVPSGYWVDLHDTMAALRRIAADSEGIVCRCTTAPCTSVTPTASRESWAHRPGMRNRGPAVPP